MASSFTLPRTLLIYALTIPLALLLGYLLITPSDARSFYALLTVAFLLCVPLLIRSHHSVLIFSWNALVCLFFLPGRPFLWMLMVFVSLVFGVINHVINRQKLFERVPGVTAALLFLALVVLLTAEIHGGIGMRALGGSSYGGKGYFLILCAIVGYFALTSKSIVPEKAPLAIKLFFLSGLTAVIGHLIYMVGPELYFLYGFFPVEYVTSQAYVDMTGIGMARYGGVSIACTSVFSYMLARYGIRGVLDFRHWPRLLVFCLAVGICPIGGFRSTVGWMGLVFISLFIFEGLVRTKYLPLFGGLAVLGLVLLGLFAHRLPTQFQRALSFLPVEVDAAAKYDAETSTNWRLEMWRALVPDLPKYVFFGKGYAMNPTDLYLTEQSLRRGLTESYRGSLEVGDYHNGPLSVYVPLGGIGVVAFVLFLVAAGRALYGNYRYGDPGLLRINTFLLALFLAQTVFFIFVFGALQGELVKFTGLVGLSVALNGGVRRRLTLPGPATGTSRHYP